MEQQSGSDREHGQRGGVSARTGGAVEQAFPAVAACADLALRRARLPTNIEATVRAALARSGHILGAPAAPRWARLFLTWIDALAGAPLAPYLPGAVACDCMAVGYDLLDQVYDSPPEERNTVLAGTLPAALSLLMLAQESLAALDAPGSGPAAACRALARAGRRALAGQVDDYSLRADSAVDVDMALSIVRRRSGPLVAAPCQCAALLTGASWRTVALAGRFGAALGCAAQLEDDRADRSEDELAGRATVPLLLARRHAAAPAVAEATLWVLHRRFLERAAQALERLPRNRVNVEVLWTLLPADLYRP